MNALHYFDMKENGMISREAGSYKEGLFFSELTANSCMFIHDGHQRYICPYLPRLAVHVSSDDMDVPTFSLKNCRDLKCM